MLKLKLQYVSHLLQKADSLEGLMLRLKLHYFGHLIRRPESLEKTLMLRKDEGRRRRGLQRTRWWIASLTQWTWI